MYYNWVALLLPLSACVVCELVINDPQAYLEKLLATVEEPKLYVRYKVTGFRINLNAPRCLDGIDVYAAVNRQLTLHNYTNAPIFDTFFQNTNGWFYINNYVMLKKGDTLYSYLVYEFSEVKRVYSKRLFKKKVLTFNTLEDDRREDFLMKNFTF